MKKILVTGSRGQLGREIDKFYHDKSEIKLIHSDVHELDITNSELTFQYIRENAPDVIINCAAYTAVDKCEEEEDVAYRINALGPKNLSLAANKVGAVLVHISTDYVFDGKKEIPYMEGDATNAISAYGRTKAAGEHFVEEIAKKYFVIRTAGLYGDGKNFVRTMLALAENQTEVAVVCDQLASPTSALELVRVIDLLIQSDRYGIYHATGEGRCTWAEVAEEIFRVRRLGVTVNKVTAEEYAAVARRPQYSVLENSRLMEEFGYQMAPWKIALKEYLEVEQKEETKYMQKKRVLVTGANGYIGRHVVKALLDMGHEVLASDFCFEGIDERVRTIDVPIFSGDADIYAQLGSPDVCIHMAWRDGFVHNSDAHIEDLPKHFLFIKNMIEGGLPSLAVMGTMHEVGYWEGPIRDDTPTNPSSLYGIAKNALRQMVELLVKDKLTKLHWLRAYYIIGDDSKSKSIFSVITKSEQEGKETFPFTMGKSRYDFINVDELARQIATASTQDEIEGTINCCTGNPVSLADKVEEYIAERSFKIRPQYGAFPDRPYDSPGVWGDATKIQTIMKNI